jgi:transcriptional regulator with XRE-family HTH domain
MDAGEKLRERIKEILVQKGEKQITIAKKMGMHTGHLSKILSGVDNRTVRVSHLEKIAEALGVPLAEFFQELYKVPILGEVTLGGGPRQTTLEAKHEYLELFPLKGCLMKDVYSLTVADSSMLPTFRAGTMLLAQRKTWEILQTNDFVVYLGLEDLQIRQVLLAGEFIVLKGVNRTMP